MQSNAMDTMSQPQSAPSHPAWEFVGKEMKRGDRRKSIRILLVGDAGVGKSSLISTAISHRFMEPPPGCLTPMTVPPGHWWVTVPPYSPPSSFTSTSSASPTGSIATTRTPMVTTIWDSSLSPNNTLVIGSGKDTTAIAVTGTTKNTTTTTTTTSSTTNSESRLQLPPPTAVDSIILVYDLDRIETFQRLETFWLPTLQQTYQGKVPVIIAENKMDLIRSNTTSTVFFHPQQEQSQTPGVTDSTMNAPSDLTTSSGSSGAAAGGGSGGNYPTASFLAEEQASTRRRQQIISLMQQFPFIRECIKCSAKSLIRVDDLFIKAQQAVLYPFTPPLYDWIKGQLSDGCKRALERIFRMCDCDHDHLLGDAELERFERDTYAVTQDYAALKKMICHHNPTDEVLIRDGKFTVEGFVAIFDLYIGQNRLDLVWQALRTFGYDDDLNLFIPEYVWRGRHVESTDELRSNLSSVEDWDEPCRLPSSAKRFLVDTFHQFDADHDGKLMAEDINRIFSVLPPPALPPWHPIRAAGLFETCFASPKQFHGFPSPESSASPLDSAQTTNTPESMISNASVATPPTPGRTTAISPLSFEPPMEQSLSSSGLSILSASDLLPSVSSGHQSLSLWDWLGHWHALNAISPSITRAELFRLGYMVEEKARKRKRQRELHMLVLGNTASGKTSLLETLCGKGVVGGHETRPTVRPETTFTHCRMKRGLGNPEVTSTPAKAAGSSTWMSRTLNPKYTGSLTADDDVEDFVVHIIITDVPPPFVREAPAQFDLAVLVFDCTDEKSFEFLKKLESSDDGDGRDKPFLSPDTPRVFVGTKYDLLVPSHCSTTIETETTPSPTQEQQQQQQQQQPESSDGVAVVVEAATRYCREMDIEDPLLTSSAATSHRESERRRILDHLVRCALNEPGVNRLRARPHEEQRRREASRRKKIMWLGGIVSVGVVLAVSMGFFWGGGSGGSKNKNQKSAFGWIRSWFGGTGGGEA